MQLEHKLWVDDWMVKGEPIEIRDGNKLRYRIEKKHVYPLLEPLRIRFYSTVLMTKLGNYKYHFLYL